MNRDTVHTYCFQDVVDQTSDRIDLRNSFMIAARGQTSKLWSLWRVFVSPHPQDNSRTAYEFLPLEDGLENDMAFSTLSAFEREQKELGLVPNPNFTYPASQYFRDKSAEYGLVFDLDTDRAVSLNRHFIPKAAVVTTPEALQTAVIAASMTEQTEPPKPFETLLGETHYHPVDFDAYFDIKKIADRVKILEAGLKAAKTYLSVMHRKKKVRRPRPMA